MQKDVQLVCVTIHSRLHGLLSTPVDLERLIALIDTLISPQIHLIPLTAILPHLCICSSSCDFHFCTPLAILCYLVLNKEHTLGKSKSLAFLEEMSVAFYARVLH